MVKGNKKNLCQDLLTIENIDSDIKADALHYTNELLERVRLCFQKLLETCSTCRNKTKKNGLEKGNDAYSLSIGVQTTINHISITKERNTLTRELWYGLLSTTRCF